MDIEDLARRIDAGDRRALSRAITLVESRRADHREAAVALIETLRGNGREALRIGMSGTPGVGKSTFIEAFGRMLTARDLRVAVLAVDPSIQRQGLATSPDGTTNRFRLTGRAGFALRDTTTDQVVAQGTATHFTGFSATGSTVATLAAERDATARLMVILADDIVDQLILSVAGFPE